MKKYLFYLSLIPLILSSCKDPEACVTASTSTAKLGQPITFTDCSVDAKVSRMNFGEGGKELDINGTLSYAYTTGPGDFTATINLYNNHDKRKASASTPITISKPTEAEIIGTWTFYKEEIRSFGIPVYNSTSEVWVFYSDYTYSIDGGSLYTWSLANNYLTMDSYTYRITKLYNGDMVLRFDEVPLFPTTYSQYYLTQ